MIPNILHYIHLSETGREWKLHHHLSVMSAVKRSGVDKIYVWIDTEPMGEWWEYTKPFVETKFVEPPSEIFGKTITQTAHKSDVIRLQLLIEYGGIYVDTDVIFVKSFEPLLQYKFVMGQQGIRGREGLCPAVMLSEKDSTFAKIWLQEFEGNFYGGPPGSKTWCLHSVDLPMELSFVYPDEITMIHHEAFFWPLYHDDHMIRLFEEVHEFPNAYAHHLWETCGKKYLDNLTVEDIKSRDTTFNLMVRDLL